MRMRFRWMAFALSFVAALAFADVKSGIISLYTFESGDASDQVGGNDGILHGGVEFVEGHNGGLAASFNGTDGYIEVPHSADFDVLANGYTVAAWAFVRNGRDHSAVAFKGQKIGWGPLYTFRIATTSNTGLTWGACNASTEGWFATNDAYNAGEWVHLALTADGSQAIAYVNGEMPASDQGNPKDIPGPYEIFPDRPIEMGVGRAVGGTEGNDAYLDGIVDDVVIYNRPLSKTEIMELMVTDLSTAVEPAGKLATRWAELKVR